MTRPDGLAFGEGIPEAIPEADVAEQRIPVDPDEDDTWLDAAADSTARTWDADEADLIEQSIEVPVPDDDLELE
ncbi:hypothetical protein A5765_11215 [Mycolicibacterium celeriflavum]|uniref:Uncharacterized protein n=1 Tax=Mycolicibacterium celeriflavum TaxID=1249101 RepID=A0A1X0BVU9_MYCCF|nr:hypothetical protein [Mycolicibacterium celeriflavum]MCV7240842.1 hypothetical protein [Mycolicibacterium celeriflavum]OBG14516.1 hypothetical protein A5765_11215 [Mycolicibacterium celeriflavum]ORA47506.1 hypothetical protein BST21_12380 [Mycolicibacterium celeriflavum]BBY42453.1 hypothetical protein MCEL_07480 [Mycolicibacterium celeriflavum]